MYVCMLLLLLLLLMLLLLLCCYWEVRRVVCVLSVVQSVDRNRSKIPSVGVCVGVGKANKKKEKKRKKGEELECVGMVIGHEITRNKTEHTYGVWRCVD